MTESKKTNHYYITVLQVISAFSVVTLHTNGCFWSFAKGRYWLTANVIECLFYFAVPIFFMITGITLIDYRERYSDRTYFEKRVKKTFVPFLAWSLIGVGYRALKGDLSLEALGIKELISMFFGSRIISVYWFFWPLFCVYLCLPLLSAVSGERRTQVFTYLLVVGSVFNILLPFVNSAFNTGLRVPLSVDVVREYLIYVVAGVLLHEKRFPRKQRLFIYLLGVCGLLLHIIGTQRLSYAQNAIVQTYKGYTNLPCMLYVFAVFVFFRNVSERIQHSRLGVAVARLGEYTFAIYLLHWFIMDIMVSLFKIDRLSIVYRLGAPFVIVALSVIITRLLRRIPVLRHILP